MSALYSSVMAFIQSFGIAGKIFLILVQVAVVFAVALLHVAYATYWERKVIGHMQSRMGPMRVGWHGLGHTCRGRSDQCTRVECRH